MEEIKFVVTGIHEFEYWNNSLLIALLEVPDTQVSDARLKVNDFSILFDSTSAKRSIETLMEESNAVET